MHARCATGDPGDIKGSQGGPGSDRGAPRGTESFKRRVSKALNERNRVRERGLEAFFENYARRLTSLGAGETKRDSTSA